MVVGMLHNISVRFIIDMLCSIQIESRAVTRVEKYNG